MYDLYQIYEQGFIDQVKLKQKNQLRPMQLVTFKYPGKQVTRRIALSLGDYPENQYFHCVKLNGIPVSEFYTATTRLIDRNIQRIYIDAYRKDVLDETLRLREYRLPLKHPLGTNMQPFYETYFKNNSLIKRYNGYRTYFMSKMQDLQIVVPNIKYFRYIPPNVEQDLTGVSSVDKIETIEKVREPDDTNIDEFTKQDKFTDE